MLMNIVVISFTAFTFTCASFHFRTMVNDEGESNASSLSVEAILCTYFWLVVSFFGLL